MKSYYVYILASKKNGALYSGVTNDLFRRTWEHVNGVMESFTKKYNIHILVYYEETNSIETAIMREKQLKRWHRQWKINLIQAENPKWHDLLTGVDPEMSSG